MCSLSDHETEAIVNEIVQDVEVKKGVKRTVEELVGDDTFSKYMESLRVPDGVLLYFKTKARVSAEERLSSHSPVQSYIGHAVKDGAWFWLKCGGLSCPFFPFASCNVQVNLNFFIPWLIYFNSIYRSG